MRGEIGERQRPNLKDFEVGTTHVAGRYYNGQDTAVVEIKEV